MLLNKQLVSICTDGWRASRWKRFFSLHSSHLESVTALQPNQHRDGFAGRTLLLVQSESKEQSCLKVSRHDRRLVTCFFITMLLSASGMCPNTVGCLNI